MDNNNLLIEINKSAFKNDHLYYTKMSEVKGLNAKMAVDTMRISAYR